MGVPPAIKFCRASFPVPALQGLPEAPDQLAQKIQNITSSPVLTTGSSTAQVLSNLVLTLPILLFGRISPRHWVKPDFLGVVFAPAVRHALQPFEIAGLVAWFLAFNSRA